MFCVHKMASFHCLWICFARRKLFCGLNMKAMNLKHSWDHQCWMKSYFELLSRYKKKKKKKHLFMMTTHNENRNASGKQKYMFFHHRRWVLSVNTFSSVKHNNRDGETCDRSQGSTVTSIILKVTEHTHIVPPTLKGHLWEHENALNAH